MEHSNFPLKYCLSTMAYLNITGEEISAFKLQKEFGYKRYEPICLMLKKIKNMSKSDLYMYKISDYIELNNNSVRIKKK